MNAKRRSQKQEKSVAKSFNAKPTIASGAIWFQKGDVRSKAFLIECKTTLKSSYSVKVDVWEKIESEAIKDGLRTPLLIIDLEDKERFVVFDPRYFRAHRYRKFNRELDEKRKKSFTISIKDFARMEDINVQTVFFKICGKRDYVLACMSLNNFLSMYAEELEELENEQ